MVVTSLLGGGLGGCRPACEDAGLQRAAAAFEAHAAEAREAGLQALGEACPALPAGLRWHLQAELTEMPQAQRSAAYRDRMDDPLWNDLRVRTCPRADESRAREGSPEAQGRLVRESCALDRYGLLAAADVLLPRDLGPFMLYEWLVSQRVDEALARQVVRPLLTAAATPAEREALCLRGELSCDALIEAWGLQPPRSSGDLRLGTATPDVLVTASAISYAGVPVVPLTAGRPAPGAFVEHVSAALLQRVESHPDARPGVLELDRAREGASLVVAADEATPAATLVDVAFTVNQRGFTELELVARREHGLVHVPLAVPFAWLDASKRRRHERGLELAFIVRRDEVVVDSGAASTRIASRQPCDALAGCYDHEALADHAARYKRLFPAEHSATFRVDGDVSVQALVSVIDTVRGGERCQLWEALTGDEVVTDDCLFWRPMLDHDPPVISHDEAR